MTLKGGYSRQAIVFRLIRFNVAHWLGISKSAVQIGSQITAPIDEKKGVDSWRPSLYHLKNPTPSQESPNRVSFVRHQSLRRVLAHIMSQGKIPCPAPFRAFAPLAQVLALFPAIVTKGKRVNLNLEWEDITISCFSME